MEKKKSNVGRPNRSGTPERILVAIKLTAEEHEKVIKLAEKFNGNINKLFRVKILGEKNGS